MKIKILAAGLIVLFSFQSLAQTPNVFIRGKIKGLTAGRKIYLLDDHLVVTHAVLSVAGGFYFKFFLHAGESDYCWLRVGEQNENMKKIILEKGDITLTGSLDHFENSTTTGSRTEQQLQEYKKFISIPSNDTQKYSTRVKQWISQHPNEAASSFLLNEMRLQDALNPDELQDMVSELGDSAKDNAPYKSMVAYLSKIKAQASVDVGKKAPDFTQPDTAGKPVSLHDFKGKFVLVDFWASWCSACREENPTVVAAYKKYHGPNFTVVGISADGSASKSAWLTAIHHDGLLWQQLSDLQGHDNVALNLYCVIGIPSNFLIDPEGIIIARNLRGVNLDKKLSEVLLKR